METARKWRVRFKREDGFMAFAVIKKKSGNPVGRDEVAEWAEMQLEMNPNYDCVDDIINEDAEDAA